MSFILQNSPRSTQVGEYSDALSFNLNPFNLKLLSMSTTSATPFANQLVTKEDLHEFKINLLLEIKQILGHAPESRKWLRSSEVRKLLNISAGTLQTLRVNGTLTYTKVGTIIYYNINEIQKLLSNSHSLNL